MRSRDEAQSASTSDLRRTSPRAHAPRRPREIRSSVHAPLLELDDTPVLEAAAAPDLTRGGTRLRAVLVGADLLAAVLGWVLAMAVPALLGAHSEGLGELALIVVAGVAVTMLAIVSQGLYRARVCAVRAVETARLGRAAAASGIAALLLAATLDLRFTVGQAIVVVLATWFLLSLGRGVYGTWLGRARAADRFCRPVVVVGTGDEGHELFRLVDLHPELGLRVSGVVGARHGLAGWDGEVEWLGDLAEVVGVVQEVGANGVIVAVSDIGADELNRLTRELLAAGIHVQLSSGLRGIDQRRLRSQPLAHEPLFYLEPVSLSRWQLLTKRVMDVIISSIVLVVAAPVLLVAAVAVKLGDGGSVLFHQTRVGQDGTTFQLFKLRTMVPDAEERLVDLTFANERQDGPLFKLTQDPRRTKVGRILERTSLDELPQLLNVLRGEMSLVGPRPALPHEVAQFDDELQGRHRVLPGITGLWQVEGRENPAFDVYRRLDLFYVENWSVGFDLAILLATLQSVLLRFAWHSSSSSSELAMPTTLEVTAERSFT